MTFQYTDNPDPAHPVWDLTAKQDAIPYSLEELDRIERTALYGGLAHRLIITAQYWHLMAKHLAKSESRPESP